MTNSDFREIAHSGGQITFTIGSDARGARGYQISVRSSRPVPTVMIGVYALPQGVPVASLNLGGLGQAWDPPPIPGCFPVLIQSDSEGKFGHLCPSCEGYWRSGPWPCICPYCGLHADGYNFLSEAQLRFVKYYCETLDEALSSGEDGEVVIDMDAVADATRRTGEKPSFYVSEESQQRKFKCRACDEFNDILGRYGYCSLCGTRNDLADFEETVTSALRERLQAGAPPNDCVRDAVSAFDSFTAQYAKQLAALVPLTERRKKRLTKQRFHNLRETSSIFENWFDINLRAGIHDSRYDEIVRLFFRRHLYEHNGGEVDQKYLDESGDATVRLKQAIHETQETAHALVTALTRMAQNLHDGFHVLLPPRPGPIEAFQQRKKRMGAAE